MKIRAKMECQTVQPQPWGGEFVRLRAIHSSDPEDNNYASATPSALAELTVSNPAARGAFVEGERYFVDFTPEHDGD